MKLEGLSRSSPLAAVPESPADVSALALKGQEHLPFAWEVGREGYHEVQEAASHPHFLGEGERRQMLVQSKPSYLYYDGSTA